MIIPNDRYVMHEAENSMYAVQMTLTIKHLQKPDFGKKKIENACSAKQFFKFIFYIFLFLGGYKCISKNSIGGIEATIRLYGKL